MALTPKKSLLWNQQANLILKHIHQVLGDGIHVFDLKNTPINLDKDDPFDEYLSSVAYAIRNSYHQTLRHIPSPLAFGRDMFINSKAELDWDKTRRRKQTKI